MIITGRPLAVARTFPGLTGFPASLEEKQPHLPFCAGPDTDLMSGANASRIA